MNTRMYLKKLIPNYTEHIKSINSDNPNLKPYMVTTCFIDPIESDYKSSSINKEKVKYTWKKYDHFYRHLVSNLMTNYTRKLDQHPLTFDFIDFPGTKHSPDYQEIHKTPHIHSIYLIQPDISREFDTMIDSNFARIRSHKSMGFLTSVHAQEITHVIDRVISYSMKFIEGHGFRSLDNEIDLFNQYPIRPGELKTRLNPRERFYEDPKHMAAKSISIKRKQRRKKQELAEIADKRDNHRDSDLYLPNLNEINSGLLIDSDCTEHINIVN